MNCRNCGTPLGENALFCPVCGQKVERNIAENPNPEEPIRADNQEATQSLPYSEPQPYPGQSEQTQQVLPHPEPQPYQGGPYPNQPYPGPQPYQNGPYPNQSNPSYPGKAAYNSANSFMIPPPQPETTSRMQAYRVTAAVMLIVSTVISLISYIVQYVVFKRLFGSFANITIYRYLGLLMPGLLISSLLPAIALLVLQKPDRSKSVTLSILLPILFFVYFGLTTVSEFIQNHSLNVTNLFTRMSSTFSLPVILLIVMAFVSVGQPKHLVGTPGPVRSRPWHIISGILHLLGALGFLIGIAALILFLGRSSRSDLASSYSILIAIMKLILYMIIAGIFAIRTGSGVRRLPLASAHMTLLVLTTAGGLVINTVVPLLTGSGSLSGLFSGIDYQAKVAYAAAGVILVFFLLWYLICSVIALVGALRKS